MTGPVDLGQTYRYRFFVKNLVGGPSQRGHGHSHDPAAGPHHRPWRRSSTRLLAPTTLRTPRPSRGCTRASGSATGGVLGSEVDVWSDAFTIETPGRMLVGVDSAIGASPGFRGIVADAEPGAARWPCAWLPPTPSSRTWAGRWFRRTFTETYTGRQRPDPAEPHAGPLDHLGHRRRVAATGIPVPAGRLGFLYYGSTTGYSSWAAGLQNVVVTCLAGYANPPWVLQAGGADADPVPVATSRSRHSIQRLTSRRLRRSSARASGTEPDSRL